MDYRLNDDDNYEDLWEEWNRYLYPLRPCVVRLSFAVSRWTLTSTGICHYCIALTGAVSVSGPVGTDQRIAANIARVRETGITIGSRYWDYWLNCFACGASMICQSRRSFSNLEYKKPSIRCLYSADGQLKDLRTDLSTLTLHLFGICQSVWLTGRKEKEQRRRGQRGHGYLSTSAENNNDFKLPYRKRQKLDSIMCTEYGVWSIQNKDQKPLNQRHPGISVQS